MGTRLYLRRVMCNSTAPPGTVSLTDEEKQRTIISLQGGKIFGSYSTNDVLFVDGVDGSDDALKSPKYISRVHAFVDHTVDDDNFEQYFLYDFSEYGTYINDKKLGITEKHTLLPRELIKFGHPNGSQNVAGGTYGQPNAEFAFIVEMVSDRDPLYEELGKMGATKVKVLSGSAVTRVMTGDTREPSPVNADCPEIGMSPLSSSSLAAHAPAQSSNGFTFPGQMPSTFENISFPSIPKRARHDLPFDDAFLCYFLANRYNDKYRDAIVAQSTKFLMREPTLRVADDYLGSFLNVHVAHKDMKSKQQKITVIENFCKANRYREGIEKLHSQMDLLADLLVEDEEETDRIRDLLVELSAQPKIGRCTNCQSNINRHDL